MKSITIQDLFDVIELAADAAVEELEMEFDTEYEDQEFIEYAMRMDTLKVA